MGLGPWVVLEIKSRSKKLAMDLDSAWAVGRITRMVTSFLFLV